MIQNRIRKMEIIIGDSVDDLIFFPTWFSDSRMNIPHSFPLFFFLVSLFIVKRPNIKILRKLLILRWIFLLAFAIAHSKKKKKNVSRNPKILSKFFLEHEIFEYPPVRTDELNEYFIKIKSLYNYTFFIQNDLIFDDDWDEFFYFLRRKFQSSDLNFQVSRENLEEETKSRVKGW